MTALQHPAFIAFSIIVTCYMVASWQWPQKFRYLLDKGNQEPSLSRIGQFTALVVSTWALSAQVLSATLTEWFFGLYMAIWAGAQATSLWMKMKGEQGKQDANK